MEDQIIMCTFRVGPLRLGIDVRHVQEVIREQQITRVPGASQFIRGLMNLRGEIVTALDLRRRLGLPEGTEHDALVNVVVRNSDSPVSLLVDEIGDVIVVDSDLFEPPPETLRGVPRELIRGAYKLTGELLLALDADSVVKLAA